MAINKKYSYKDFTDKDLTSLPASDFNNSEIVGSCFYQQKAPNTQVFPTGITGVTFRKCNLDNVLIPPGNTVDGGCHRKIKIHNDLEDWIVDDLGKPIKPVNPSTFNNLGLSIDPKDIQLTKDTISATEKKREANQQADIDAVKALGGGIAERLGVK